MDDGQARADQVLTPTTAGGNDPQGYISAVLAGLGLAYLLENQVQAHLAEGRLIRVLADWCPPFSGYHLYYPSRRQSSPAFALIVDEIGRASCRERV